MTVSKLKLLLNDFPDDKLVVVRYDGWPQWIELSKVILLKDQYYKHDEAKPLPETLILTLE